MTCLKTYLGIDCREPHTERPSITAEYQVNRDTPFMVRVLEWYNGDQDEINPDHVFDKDCGWCGRPLDGLKTCIEPMLGDPCCCDKCAKLLDDWMFKHVVDPEHEIPKILKDAKHDTC